VKLFGIDAAAESSVGKDVETTKGRQESTRQQFIDDLRGGAEGIARWLRRSNQQTLLLKHLKKCDFSNVDLTGVVWFHPYLSHFQGSNFENSNLSTANLDRCFFEGSNFLNAIIDGASICHTDASNSDFCGASMKDANCLSSSFVGAKMQGANLSNANLSFADLRAPIYPMPA